MKRSRLKEGLEYDANAAFAKAASDYTSDEEAVAVWDDPKQKRKQLNVLRRAQGLHRLPPHYSTVEKELLLEDNERRRDIAEKNRILREAHKARIARIKAENVDIDLVSSSSSGVSPPGPKKKGRVRFLSDSE